MSTLRNETLERHQNCSTEEKYNNHGDPEENERGIQVENQKPST
jgi:hypothetical protein